MKGEHHIFVCLEKARYYFIQESRVFYAVMLYVCSLILCVCTNKHESLFVEK